MIDVRHFDFHTTKFNDARAQQPNTHSPPLFVVFSRALCTVRSHCTRTHILQICRPSRVIPRTSHQTTNRLCTLCTCLSTLALTPKRSSPTTPEPLPLAHTQNTHDSTHKVTRHCHAVSRISPAAHHLYPSPEFTSFNPFRAYLSR